MAEQNRRSAAVPAAGTEASRLRFGEVRIRDRGRLPHWEKDAGLYFVTFRLADSLPQHVLIELEKQVASPAKKPLPRAELKELSERRIRLIEAYLDRGSGKCHLAHSNIADLISSALKFRENQDYRLQKRLILTARVLRPSD